MALLLLGVAFPVFGVSIIEQPVAPAAPVALGRAVTLSVRAEAETGRPVFQWRLNGVNIPGATESSLTLETFQAEQGGRYEVLVAEPERGVAGADLVTSQPVILVPDLPVAILSDPLAYTSRLPFENPTGAFRADNTRATVQRRLGEPLHAGQPGGASVWLWWIAPQSGSVRFRTHGSAIDTLLAVYEVPNPNPSEPLLFSYLVPVVANDNASPYKTSAAAFNAVQGTHYFIAVDGMDATLAGTGRGSIVLSWAFDPPSLAFRLPEIKSQPTNAAAPDGAPITLNFNVDFGTAARTEVQWFRNGRPIDGATDLQLPIAALTPTQVGRHFARIITFDADNKPQTNQTEVVDVQIRNRSDGSDPELLAWDRYSSSRAQASGGAAPAGLGGRGVRRPAGLARGVSGFQIFNTSLNTAEIGEPTLCAGIGGKSAWYTFEADDDGVVEVDTEGSEFDTVLGAFFDDARGPGLFDGFQRLACNDDAGPGVKFSRVAFRCAKGDFYTLIVDAVGGTADLVRLNYRLGPVLRITSAPSSQTGVAGQTISFGLEVEGFGAKTYLWERNSVPFLTNGAPALTLSGVKEGDAGTYRVTVRNEIGEVVVSAPFTLTVTSPPSITEGPASLTVKAGEAAGFTVAASGAAPLSYQWLKGGVEIPGATQASFVIPSAQAADAGTYTVRVSNGAGFQVSAPANLVVLVPPAFVAQPGNLTVNQGQPATFAVEVTGTDPLTFQWLKGGVEIPGATQPSLVIPSVQAADAGTYTVRVSNGAGIQVSAPANLVVLVPPAFVAQPGNLTVNEGQPATFAVEVTGIAPITFQWLKGEVEIPGATQPSLVLSSTQETDAGQYSVRVSNAAGEITSAPGTLVVRVPATITLPLADLVLNEGQSGTFQVAARGTPPLVYQWFKGEGEIPGATAESLSIDAAKGADAGVYSVRVSNVAGSQTSSATLTVRLLPRIVAAPQRAVVKAGDPAEFLVSVEGSAPFSFQWFRNGQPVPGANSDMLLIPAAGSGNAGDYSVRVSNAAGAVESGPAALVVNEPVSIAQQPVAQQVVPEGRTVVLSVGATGTAPLGYQWYRGDSPIPGATGSTLDLGAAELGDTGTYAVAVSNMVNRVVSRPSILTVLRSPAIEDPPLPQAVEAGTAVTLSVVASGSAPLAFQWRRDGTPVPGGVTATLRIPSASAADAGLYSVVVSNPVGSVETAPVRVQVNTASPVRAVMETPQLLEDGRLRVAFTGTPGRQYLVQQTFDWVTWTTVKTTVLGASGTADYVSDGPVAGFGVFRVVTPPGVIAGVQLNPPILVEGNRLRLTFLGSPGVEYVVEESDDLGTWRVLGSSLADEQGAGEFVAEVVPGAFRVYRVITPATASPVSFQTPEVTPEGMVRLGLQAPPGRVLLLQESSDLLNWTTVRQVVIEPGGSARVETPIDPAGLRWFRLVAAPGQP